MCELALIIYESVYFFAALPHYNAVATVGRQRQRQPLSVPLIPLA